MPTSRLEMIQEQDCQRAEIAQRLAGLGLARMGGHPLDLSYEQWTTLLDLAERGRQK